MLKEMITNIFEQDKNALEIIRKSMGEEVIEQYPKIPTDIDSIINSIDNTENAEFYECFVLEAEENWGGLKFPEGSNVMCFRIMDVRLRRRKIFKFGDYYVNLIHSGLGKWDVVFFTKSRKVVYNDDSISFEDHLYPAQHPHVSGGRPCFGTFDTPIRASINHYDISGFLFQIKLYLNNWNYRSPHHMPERFEHFNQPIVNENFIIEALLNDFNVSKVEENYDITFSDVSTIQTFEFISARYKSYETEPLCRIIMEQDTWYKKTNRGNVYKYALLSLYYYFINKYNETLYQPFEHPHDCVVYILELFRLLDNVSYHHLRANQYEWTPNDERTLVIINNFKQEHLKYYTNQVDESNSDRIYNDSFIYYLNSDLNQSDEVKNKYNRLGVLIQQLTDIKYNSDCESPSRYMISRQSYKYLGELLQNPDVFNSKMFLINLINDLEINRETNNTEKQKIDMIIEEFTGDIQPFLKDAMEIWKINYHETELRRLRNDKYKVNIEELNI